MVETERFARKSFAGFQCAPLSTVFQMPPETPPASHVDGRAGLITIDRTRPPILPGPNHVQPEGVIPAPKGSTAVDVTACNRRIVSTCSFARINPSGGT